MQYEDAKTFLLGCEWPNIPKYQKERETSETNSSKKSIGFEFANGRQLALGTTKKTKIWIENFAEKLPHPSYLTYLPTDTRTSTLRTTAPNVAGPRKKGDEDGNSAYYVEIANKSELKKLLAWYGGQQPQEPNSNAYDCDSSPGVPNAATSTPLSAPENERSCGQDTASRKTAEREALVKVRYGQGNFREALFHEGGEERCWMSGIEGRRLLIASHIKPWSDCRDDIESRGQPNNGILLSALWDTAFDAGLISFEADGRVIASSELADSAKRALGFDDHTLLPDKYMNPQRSKYHAYHRKEVFEKWKKPKTADPLAI